MRDWHQECAGNKGSHKGEVGLGESITKKKVRDYEEFYEQLRDMGAT